MGYKILAIDDESICLEIISFSLKFDGNQVILIDSGIQALEYLEKDQPDLDLIILDLMMPEIYGLEVLKLIKKDDKYKKYKNTPILLQTGSSNREDINEALILGNVSYVLKPYKRNELIQAVKDTMENASAASAV